MLLTREWSTLSGPGDGGLGHTSDSAFERCGAALGESGILEHLLEHRWRAASRTESTINKSHRGQLGTSGQKNEKLGFNTSRFVNGDFSTIFFCLCGKTSTTYEYIGLY